SSPARITTRPLPPGQSQFSPGILLLIVLCTRHDNWRPPRFLTGETASQSPGLQVISVKLDIDARQQSQISWSAVATPLVEHPACPRNSSNRKITKSQNREIYVSAISLEPALSNGQLLPSR